MERVQRWPGLPWHSWICFVRTVLPLPLLLRTALRAWSVFVLHVLWYGVLTVMSCNMSPMLTPFFGVTSSLRVQCSARSYHFRACVSVGVRVHARARACDVAMSVRFC